ncbi:MAG: AAA family ATPase [Holosporales bacterium]|jgi:DNA replication and repair protein RecF|nr:AAA family ATPase [Holosporales bacterium]
MQHLILNNFRNYAYYKINISNTVYILTGANGQGKTNILEAISLFSGTRGLLHSRSDEMVNSFTDKNFWSVSLLLDNIDFTISFKENRKIYKVSEKNAPNLSEFSKIFYILWMTYETDRLFVESPANRRNFIDMFALSKFPNHQKNLKTYEKLSRERIKILKQCSGTASNQAHSKWLDILENQISSVGIEIAKARISISKSIENGQNYSNIDFPKYHNRIIGKLETDNMDLEKYKIELRNRRQKDFFTNSTTYGPNKSDWEVIHIGKNIKANMCSAGEQKILLLGIFLNFLWENISNDSRNLILLLDDIIVHLDASHSQILFRYIKDMLKFFEKNGRKIMVWLTGTNKTFFNELSDVANFIEL